MPEKSGLELSERIKALRPDLKVLFMSGYAADIISEQGEGEGEKGINFLPKPVELDVLAEKVRTVLEAG